MLHRKGRVVVGVEPYMLRTAIHDFFARHPGLDSVLLPERANILDEPYRADADILLVSQMATVEASTVVAEVTSDIVELRCCGATRTLRFNGLPALADILSTEIHLRGSLSRKEAAPARNARAR